MNKDNLIKKSTTRPVLRITFQHFLHAVFKKCLTESKIYIYMNQICSHENKTQKSAKNKFHFRFLKHFGFRCKTIFCLLLGNQIPGPQISIFSSDRQLYYPFKSNPVALLIHI